jgi:hypothetical protein
VAVGEPKNNSWGSQFSYLLHGVRGRAGPSGLGANAGGDGVEKIDASGIYFLIALASLVPLSGEAYPRALSILLAQSLRFL